jgi:hypothetical protein
MTWKKPKPPSSSRSNTSGHKAELAAMRGITVEELEAELASQESVAHHPEGESR